MTNKPLSLPMLADAKSGEPLTFLRLREVCRRSGLARSTLYRRIAEGDFPGPVKLGTRAGASASAWPAHEVDAWCRSRIAARDAKAPE